jgi:hypothetical protein
VLAVTVNRFRFREANYVKAIGSASNRNGATPQNVIFETAREGMREFRQYRRKQIAELRPYQPGEDISGVSISEADKEAGSPKAGDMIARNPKNRADKWLVAAQYFADNFEPV